MNVQPKFPILLLNIAVFSMQTKRLNILIASMLAGLFTIFNVGLPIALYVCPMMANERCTCSCTKPSANQPVLTYVHTSCCNHSVLAERNTIPFLGSHRYVPPPSEVMFVLTFGTPWTAQQPFQLSSLAISDPGPPASEIPLYLLSSSLLI